MTEEVLIPCLYDGKNQWERGKLLAISSNITGQEIDDMLALAYESGVSDVNFSSGDFVFFDIYGRLTKASSRKLLESELQMILTHLIDTGAPATLSSGIDINRTVEIKPTGTRNKAYRFRFNAVRARIGKIGTGVQITMRTIPQIPVELSTLKLPQTMQDAMFPENGLILVVGITGSGKTTLLYSVLRFVVETMADIKVITHESPVEYTFEHVKCAGMMPSQIEVPFDLPNYEVCVEAAMRRASEYILFGECRKRDEFGAMVNAALSGHATFTTLHAETVDQTVNRILNMFPFDEQQSIADKLLGSLRLIVAQKLIKTSDGKRAPVREWLVFDDEIKERLAQIPFVEWSRVIREEVKSKNQRLKDSAKALFDEGRVDRSQFISSMGCTPESVH